MKSVEYTWTCGGCGVVEKTDSDDLPCEWLPKIVVTLLRCGYGGDTTVGEFDHVCPRCDRRITALAKEVCNKAQSTP